MTKIAKDRYTSKSTDVNKLNHINLENKNNHFFRRLTKCLNNRKVEIKPSFQKIEIDEDEKQKLQIYKGKMLDKQRDKICNNSNVWQYYCFLYLYLGQELYFTYNECELPKQNKDCKITVFDVLNKYFKVNSLFVSDRHLIFKDMCKYIPDNELSIFATSISRALSMIFFNEIANKEQFILKFFSKKSIENISIDFNKNLNLYLSLDEVYDKLLKYITYMTALKIIQILINEIKDRIPKKQTLIDKLEKNKHTLTKEEIDHQNKVISSKLKSGRLCRATLEIFFTLDTIYKKEETEWGSLFGYRMSLEDHLQLVGDFLGVPRLDHSVSYFSQIKT